VLAQQIRRKFSVEEYIALFQQNIVTGSKTELIDGEVIELSPLGFRHAKTQQLLQRFLASQYCAADVYQTGSVIVDQNNMLEPDVYVLRPDTRVEDNYPKAAQLLLAVEVADSTIASDRLNDGQGKLGAYAKGSVPTVWVMDINAMSLYVFSEPKCAIYSQCVVHTGDTEILGKTLTIRELITG